MITSESLTPREIQAKPLNHRRRLAQKVETKRLNLHLTKKVNAQKLMFSDPSNQQVDDLSLKPLGSLLRSSKGIRELDLHFPQNRKIKNSEMDPISQGLKNVHSLQTIKVAIPNCKLSPNIGCYHLFQSLKRLPHVQSFTLEISSRSEIIDQSLYFIGQGMKGLGLLRNLSISFELSKVKDKGLNFISNCLKKFRYLEKLSFELSNCPQITDKGLTNFSSNLKKIAPLKEITLHVWQCSKATESGFCEVFDALGKLATLQKVNFAFTGELERPNGALFSFDRGLKKLSGLETLDLHFGFYFKFDDEGMYYLGESLAELVHLKKLTLCLMACSNMNEGWYISVKDCPI